MKQKMLLAGGVPPAQLHTHSDAWFSHEWIDFLLFRFKTFWKRNVIFVNLLFLSFGAQSQLFTLDFNSDICGGDGCDLEVDLIEPSCVYMVNPDIPVYSLGGFNKITNDCDIEIGNGDNGAFSDVVQGGSNKRLIFQKGAQMRANQGWMSMGNQTGIFLNIPTYLLPNNYFYQVKFDMEQILPYDCLVEIGGIPTEPPTAPTISVYSTFQPDYEDEFIFSDKSYNEFVRDFFADNLGSYTTNGKPIGTYTSPAFKFFNENENTPESYFQLAFFNFGNDAGDCDGPPPSPPSEEAGVAELYKAGLMDNVVIDCDQQNIAFTFEVKLTDLDELVNCDERLYTVELNTDCPNVNYLNFNYDIKVKNSNNQIVKTIPANGQIKQFSLEDLPTGSYTVYIIYNTSNGYNVKVNQYFYASQEEIINHEQNGPYRIYGTFTYDTPIYVPTGIEVMSGATLNINSNAYFKDEKKLQVNQGGQLYVNSTGDLTACQTIWTGIQMQGVGKVEINGGTVSRARWGVWSEGIGSAEVNCNGAQFIDNGTGAVIKDMTVPSFNDCYFTGGEKGVHLESVTGGTTPNGVLFEGNTFSYQSNEGIIAWNTPINVQDGNQFIGCIEGIAMRNLFGLNTESLIGGAVCQMCLIIVIRAFMLMGMTNQSKIIFFHTTITVLGYQGLTLMSQRLILSPVDLMLNYW